MCFSTFVACRQPWRSTHLPAARLRPSVGPLAARNAVAGQTCQPDIIKNNRTSSGHFRAFPGISGHRRIREDRRVRYRPLPVMPSRMARRCGIARRRIACRMDRRVRYRRSPDTASGIVVACRRVRRRIACGIARRRTRRHRWSSRAVSSVAGSRAVWPVACEIVPRRIACRRARRRIASRHVPARVGDLDISPMFTVGRAEGPSSAMPRPNSRLSPTPPAAGYEHVFLCCAVALHHVVFGGAAKADRWAALIP